MSGARLLGLRVMAGLYVLAGAMHFLRPDAYRPMMPPWLPAHEALAGVDAVVAKDGVVPRSDEGIVSDERGVEPALRELGQQRVGLVFAPRHLQGRQCAHQRLGDLGQQVRAHRGNDANPHAAPQGIPVAPGGVDQVGRRQQYAPGPVDDCTASGAQPHAARAALEHLDAERRFDLRDLGTQRRLGDAARIRRAPEATEVGHRDQVLQLPKRERECIPGRHSCRLSFRHTRYL